LLHRLCRLVQRIRRRGDHRDVLVLELGSSLLECSQLLLAVRSPVSTIEQQDPPAGAKGVGKREPPVRNGLHAQRRKQLATVENSRSGSCHHRSLLWPSVAASCTLLDRHGFQTASPPASAYGLDELGRQTLSRHFARQRFEVVVNGYELDREVGIR